MQLVCKSLFTKGVKNVHHLHGHILEMLSPLVNCSVNNDLSEIGPYRHTTIKHFFSTLRTVNEQKQNVGILHGVNLYIYFHDIWQISVG